MTNAKIVKKLGQGVRGSIEFEMESMKEITPAQAMEAQLELGYHPQGYAFQDFKVKLDPVLHTFKATWKCQASCD